MTILHRVAIATAVSFVALTQTFDLHAQAVPGTEFSSVEALFDITGAGEARSIYDPQTGEVFFAIGSGINVFGIEGDFFRVENVIFDDALGAAGTQADAAGIAAIIFSQEGFPVGIYNLGQVLDPDANILTAADFLNEFPASLTVSGGFGSDNFESGVNVLVAVPEPSAIFALSALACTALCTRRRSL